MFFHASRTPNISILQPRVSNHGEPFIYFSTKRENTLVYLCNAIEKHCRQVGFDFGETCKTWASYGFTKDGILCLDEYYPNATLETYKGESGYIYYAAHIGEYENQADIPFAVTARRDVPMDGCEFIPDAYEAIMNAVNDGLIVLHKYSENSQAMMDWIERVIKEDYRGADIRPEYKLFLEAKFGSFLL